MAQFSTYPRVPGASSGQKTMAQSSPVVIASDQSAVHTIVDSAAIAPGAATEAKQDTGNTSLASIDSHVIKANTDSVTVVTSALPSGAATSANQSTANTSLASIDSHLIKANTDSVTVTVSALPTGAATSAGQTTANASLASIDSHIIKANTDSVIVTTSALPTGAAVAAKQPAIGTAGAPSGDVISVQGIASMTALKVDGSGVTQPVSGTFFQATQPVSSTQLPASLGQKTSANSLAVTLSSDQSAVSVSLPGKSRANAPVYNDYGSSPVTTTAFTNVIASSSNAANLIEVFDSSGQALLLAVGAPGSEVTQFYIFPGGNGQVPLSIPAGSRVSLKALTANATSGYILLNLYS